MDTSYYLVDTGFAFRGPTLRWSNLENPWYDRAVLSPSLFTLLSHSSRVGRGSSKVGLEGAT